MVIVLGQKCLPEDGSISPRCEEWVQPDNPFPVFIEHQWSKYAVYMYIQFQPFFVFRPRQCDKVIEQGLNHIATVNTDLTQSTTFEWQENDVVPLRQWRSCYVPSVSRWGSGGVVTCPACPAEVVAELLRAQRASLILRLLCCCFISSTIATTGYLAKILLVHCSYRIVKLPTCWYSVNFLISQPSEQICTVLSFLKLFGHMALWAGYLRQLAETFQFFFTAIFPDIFGAK